MDQLDEAGEEGPGSARVDDVLDLEGLGGAADRGIAPQFRLDLPLACRRVGGALDPAANADRDSAFERQ